MITSLLKTLTLIYQYLVSSGIRVDTLLERVLSQSECRICCLDKYLILLLVFICVFVCVVILILEEARDDSLNIIVCILCVDVVLP